VAAAKKKSRFFLIAFLNSPCYETPKNVIKHNREKQPGEKKKTEEKKAAIFCDERRWIFPKRFHRVFELSLSRIAQKRDKKNQ
jgi:hypothetical protein